MKHIFHILGVSNLHLGMLHVLGLGSSPKYFQLWIIIFQGHNYCIFQLCVELWSWKLTFNCLGLICIMSNFLFLKMQRTWWLCGGMLASSVFYCRSKDAKVCMHVLFTNKYWDSWILKGLGFFLNKSSWRLYCKLVWPHMKNICTICNCTCKFL